MGVGEDFSRFKDRYNIDASTMASISYRYRRITRQLNKDFWNTESETAHSLYVGSYGRDTAARGLSDLDVGFVLPSSLYHQYNAYLGNGQSALLQAVKRSIQKTYTTSESFGDGQVVVVSFTDGITFEILPAFDNSDGDSWTYPNANGGGSWKTCNPRAEMRAVDTRSLLTNRNLKYLCRMMRVWRDVHSVPMSGMLIDTLAYQFIEGWAHRDKSFFYHDYMARDFFLYLSQRDTTKSYWRAPGSGALVARKGPFERKAASAYAKALEAITYDANGQEWSRRQKWREIFGTLFPA
jgi:hypothetical protein